MPKLAPNIPDQLRAYVFHGLRLGPPDGRGQCSADCPACGSSKFSVHVDTGMFSCYSAGCPHFVEGGGGGGSTKFIRWLWEESDRRMSGGGYDEFAADRGLLNWETLSWWGACQSLISGEWLFPAHNPEGALTQLYKRVWAGDRWELRPTPFRKADPSHGHALHGVPLLHANADTVYLCEGPGDAMILWESLRMARAEQGALEFTGNPDAGMLAHSSVLAVPNCGAVGEPLRRYLELFRGRQVVLCFDNDHAKGDQDGAGWAATKRASGLLADVAREVAWVNWGGGTSVGYNSSLPNGYDVRDALRIT